MFISGLRNNAIRNEYGVLVRAQLLRASGAIVPIKRTITETMLFDMGSCEKKPIPARQQGAAHFKFAGRNVPAIT